MSIAPPLADSEPPQRTQDFGGGGFGQPQQSGFGDLALTNLEENKTDNDRKAEAAAEKAAARKALLPFAIISLSYLLYTMTDGSIRMIVLLHAYNKSFTAMEVAVMFTLYEAAGVVTNLLAGLAGAKWGIKWTLLVGLTLQLGGLGMLFGWRDDWSKGVAIIYVTIAQMLCGVAKDLTKLGGKTVTKLVTPDEKQSALFKLVSYITGFKNSLKGVGYFIGAGCLAASDEWGYYLALGINVVLILLAYPWAVLKLDANLGTAKSKNVTLREALFNSNYNLNWLSLARLFLFASRDLWFEVPLPFYLRSPACPGIGKLCDEGRKCGGGLYCGGNFQANVAGSQGTCMNIAQGGQCGGVGLERVTVGLFLALYIILYGQMQAFTPQLVLQPLKQSPPNKWTEVLWGYINCLPPLTMGIVMLVAPSFKNNDVPPMLAGLITIIAIFAVLFAINSSIHSYLVVRYAEGNKVAQSVGFYYMSNAAGRLMGTLVSGALYSYVDTKNATIGIGVCFLAGAASSFLATVITHKIRDNEAGLHCGSLVCIGASEKEPDKKADLESTLGHVSEPSKQDETFVATVATVASMYPPPHMPASANAMPPGR